MCFHFRRAGKVESFKAGQHHKVQAHESLDAQHAMINTAEVTVSQASPSAWFLCHLLYILGASITHSSVNVGAGVVDGGACARGIKESRFRPGACACVPPGFARPSLPSTPRSGADVSASASLPWTDLFTLTIYTFYLFASLVSV